MKEHIAVAEAVRLGIPVFAIVDTNSDPRDIDYVIPANDDSTQGVDLIIGAVCAAIAEGQAERKAEGGKGDSEDGEEEPRRINKRGGRRERREDKQSAE